MSDGAFNAGNLRSLTDKPGALSHSWKGRPAQTRSNDLLISRPGEAGLTSTSFVYGRVSNFVWPSELGGGTRPGAGGASMSPIATSTQRRPISGATAEAI